MKKRTCKRDETGFIVTFTVTFILSLILFQTMMPELSLYLLMSSAIWAGIWIKLNFYNNLVPFAKFVTIGGANLLAWLLVRFFFSEGSEVLTASHGIALSLYGVYLIIVSIAVYRTLYKRRDCNGINEAALLPSRQRDLERILEYISRYSIVGINGRWGTGKTFLMRECVRMLKEEYEIIQVDLLSSNLDELQSLLLKEIEKVMARNGILSVYSNELAGLFQASGFGRGIQGLLFQQKSSYSALLSGFLGDLKKLNKKILIIYEDIDRIQRIEIISKIFNISEKLAGENIKIVYE